MFKTKSAARATADFYNEVKKEQAWGFLTQVFTAASAPKTLAERAYNLRPVAINSDSLFQDDLGIGDVFQYVTYEGNEYKVKIAEWNPYSRFSYIEEPVARPGDVITTAFRIKDQAPSLELEITRTEIHRGFLALLGGLVDGKGSAYRFFDAAFGGKRAITSGDIFYARWNELPLRNKTYEAVKFKETPGLLDLLP